MKPKFNVGDIIGRDTDYHGFEEAQVLAIEKGCYKLKIPNGTATIPIRAEVCYKILTKSFYLKPNKKL